MDEIVCQYTDLTDDWSRGSTAESWEFPNLALIVQALHERGVP